MVCYCLYTHSIPYNSFIDLPSADVETIKAKLSAKDIAFVAQRDLPGNDGQSSVFFYCRTLTNVVFLVELKLKRGLNIAKVTVKSPNKAFSEICKQTIAKLLV